MMRLRPEQLATMRRALALDAFTSAMLAHLPTFAPRHCEVIGRDGLRRAIDLGIARAREHGVENPGLLRFYLELMIMFGSSFDTDPLLPWAGVVLRDPSLPGEAERVDRLYDAMLAHLAEVEGPRGASPRETMHALEQLLAEGFPAAAVVVEQKAVEVMYRINPARCAQLGEPLLLAHVQRAALLAADLGLATPRGVVLVAAMMFVMGHGFAADPLYPWVGVALAAGGSAEERVERLHRRASIYVEWACKHLDREWADGQR